MPRPKGSKNIPSFVERDNISTNTSANVKHMSSGEDKSPVEKFNFLINHQFNFSKWLKSRHENLREAKREISELTDRRVNIKDATFTKYQWYAEYLMLLEAINNFEVFYKETLSQLAIGIHKYVPPSKIRGSVDNKFLWDVHHETNVLSLIFEHQLYHDLDNVDKMTDMLIGKRRYNVNSPNGPNRKLVKSLQAIFQIRHTLSHNAGLITSSDSTKLQILGYKAETNEVIDPNKDSLSLSIKRVLIDEAENFTVWLRENSFTFLIGVQKQRELTLPGSLKNTLVALLGKDSNWNKLNWEENV